MLSYSSTWNRMASTGHRAVRSARTPEVLQAFPPPIIASLKARVGLGLRAI